MRARTLMVQGTASSVGKSLVVAGLCRLFRRAGVRVAPFKAQNMALNAAVAVDGGEVGRAQAVQAEAAEVPLTVDMNPVLLKPESDGRSQVVVLGQARGVIDARNWGERRAELAPVIAGALDRLRAAHELVVIEGAGSPAEINLQATDLVNMHVARLAEAPVLLVADIDRGGVFASLVGTLELLPPDDRARVRGMVINKFRGDRSLLQPGLEFLEQRTGLPVLGVLPFVRDLGIAEEDSVNLDERAARPEPSRPEALQVAVVRLPHLSNQDDFDALAADPDVQLRFVDRPEHIAGADLVVLPGSKTTVGDLLWLRELGFEPALRARAHRGEPLLGICGGCQMLGEQLRDPKMVESELPSLPGLGLLPIATHFQTDKTTARVQARVVTPSFLTDGQPLESALAGYEIHAGEVSLLSDARPLVRIERRNGQTAADADGAVDGSVVGTLIHGLLDSAELRGRLLAHLRRRRGLPATGATGDAGSDRADRRPRGDRYDRWADVLQQHLDWPRIRALAGLP
jgi:adenosylcobyric acid synthase